MNDFFAFIFIKMLFYAKNYFVTLFKDLDLHKQKTDTKLQK